MKPVVEVRDLCIRSHGRAVIRDFSWSHGPGAIAWVIGENGAGKSSLIRALAGRAAATGVVRLVPPTSLYYHPGMSAPEARVREWHRLFARVRARGLVPAADTLRPRLDPRALTSQLSTGETKRLVLAELLAQPAANVLLDEPYEHLSHTAKARLTEVLQLRAARSLLVVATNQDIPGYAPVILHVDGDATARVLPCGATCANPTKERRAADAPEATATAPIRLHFAALLRFDLFRLTRGRFPLASLAFATLLVLGHVPVWRGASGADDRLFGYGFMLLLVGLWRLGIGADRRTAWDEYVVLNHAGAGRYIGARIGAGIVLLLLACVTAFGAAALISGADLRFAAWHTSIWLFTGLLLFPALLAVELLLDTALPFAVVVLGCLALGMVVVGLDRAEPFQTALGIDFGRYAWSELGRLITFITVFGPLSTVTLALLWRRRFRRQFTRSWAASQSHVPAG